VVTNEKKELYETWHPIGLHVVPGVWSLIIASYHEALFELDVSSLWPAGNNASFIFKTADSCSS
jgi:hypothetical protein